MKKSQNRRNQNGTLYSVLFIDKMFGSIVHFVWADSFVFQANLYNKGKQRIQYGHQRNAQEHAYNAEEPAADQDAEHDPKCG